MGRLDEDFFKAETRCDFLVDEKRKKVWAVALGMLERFDEVCRKHHLSYWVSDGTLLGAVRHQGFVPWDDDIDVVMFRDDYETFQRIAPSEITEPYFFQNSYTDIQIWPLSKIRDSRTTGIEFRDLKDMHQGIFMDIFPLDSVEDGINQQFSEVVVVQKLLWNMVTVPVQVLSALKEDLLAGRKTKQDIQYLLDISKLDVRERFRIFEEFNLAHFGETENVNYIMEEFMPTDLYKSVKKDWFRETVYLPFEHIKVPAPVDYDKFLTRRYGDYHQLVRGGGLHQNIILDPDIPYKEYFEKYL